MTGISCERSPALRPCEECGTRWTDWVLIWRSGTRSRRVCERCRCATEQKIAEKWHHA
jgi:hypothetical protein